MISSDEVQTYFEAKFDVPSSAVATKQGKEVHTPKSKSSRRTKPYAVPQPEWEQYHCQFCDRGPVSAKKGSVAARLKMCTVCLRKATVSETLKRLRPINDPAITQMLKDFRILTITMKVKPVNKNELKVWEDCL